LKLVTAVFVFIALIAPALVRKFKSLSENRRGLSQFSDAR